MDLRDVPVDELVLDPKLNLRDRLDQETVERYEEAWERMPPVTVFDVDGRWLLADGFHRHASAIRMDRRTIRAEIRAGSMEDALDFVTGANLSHGLPLTRSERRRVVETKLLLHPDHSDRRLSDEMGVGREMIARVRKQLVDAGQIAPSTTRVGADGKTYPSAGLPRDPNEHLPRDRSGGGQDDPRDRGRRESDPAPWDDATAPMPPVRDQPGFPGGGAGGFASPPWDDASAKALAIAPPIAPAAPTIDEMIGMMTDQINNLLHWAEDEDFAEAYREASQSARSLFQDAGFRLANRIENLRRG